MFVLVSQKSQNTINSLHTIRPSLSSLKPRSHRTRRIVRRVDARQTKLISTRRY